MLYNAVSAREIANDIRMLKISRRGGDFGCVPVRCFSLHVKDFNFYWNSNLHFKATSPLSTSLLELSVVSRPSWLGVASLGGLSKGGVVFEHMETPWRFYSP